MGQNNNHKSNFHFLILGCKSFAVNYSLKSGMHRHHQTLCFTWWCSARPLLQPSSSSCLFLGHFPFSFVFSKWNACSIGFRSGALTWPLHNSSPSFPSKTLWLLLQYALGHCPSALWSAVQWVQKHLAEYEQIILPETLQNSILLLLSAVTFINKYKENHSTGSPYMPTPWHYHHHALTDDGVLLRILSSSFPSPYSSLPITLVQVDLGLICP